MDILTRDREGFPVSTKEPEFSAIREIQNRSWKIQGKLNMGYHEAAETRKMLEDITNRKIPESVTVLTPFYTDFGRNIVFGENVFVNTNCTFMDRGGITIESGALIGPNVNLITINHDQDPMKRHITYCNPIHICKNVWIGVGATVLPGVTIGEGSIIAAGAVVTTDVPPMTVVGGIPAKVIQKIRPEQISKVMKGEDPGHEKVRGNDNGGCTHIRTGRVRTYSG